jgi:hypothetical protein
VSTQPLLEEEEEAAVRTLDIQLMAVVQHLLQEMSVVCAAVV